MDKYGIGIIATDYYLPKYIQTNDELCEELTDVTPEWILSKTGIKRRFLAKNGETASSMAVEVAKKIIDKNNINPNDIGLIIVASFSQDYLFPPLSAKIHLEIGASRDCQIIDLNTNCVGLVTALTVANERMLGNENIKYAIVIGVEMLSPFTNYQDKDTSIYFSDGASGVLLGKVDHCCGHLHSKFATDSSTYESVRMRGGGSNYPINRPVDDFNSIYMEQNGLATWKQAITNQPYVISELIKESNLKYEDIDFFIFHQANGFLIDYILRKLKIPKVKTYINVEEIGNTGSASIGIALSEAFEKELIKKNNLIILTGVGAGFNFGASLWKV